MVHVSEDKKLELPNLQLGSQPHPARFDDVFGIVGKLGRFQIALWLGLVNYQLIKSCASSLPVFVQFEPDFHCQSQIDRLPMETDDKCGNEMVVSCFEFESAILNRSESDWAVIECRGSFNYSREEHVWNSLVTEFDLVCDRKIYNTIATMSFFLGWIPGGLGKPPLKNTTRAVCRSRTE